MKTYSVAEAKARFSEVLELAASGEEVLVTKHGKADIESPGLQSIDWERLRKLREFLPKLDISATELVRQIRDEGH